MKIKILNISGMAEALYGLGLSFGKTKGQYPSNMEYIMADRADKNAHLGLGHNKFLESIIAWIEITGSRAFWAECDTYRLMTKQSDSTMHTLFKDCKDKHETKILAWASLENTEMSDCLVDDIDDYYRMFANLMEKIKCSDMTEIQKINIAKMLLPEGWQQTRVLCVSYKTLQNIYAQRKNHKLYEWSIFCNALKDLPHSKWITNG
jgi:hypothetical protein